GIPHHMIGFCDPRRNYSAADYVDDASRVIADIADRGKTPVIVGGTGLYLDSLLFIGSFSEAGEDPAIREELFRIAGEDGPSSLHAMLRAIDPEAAEKIHENNVKRVVRAIEVYRLTGKTKTEADREALAPAPRYDATVVTLDFEDRATLYGRIEKRVDKMFADGLEDEVRGLLERGELPDSSTAAQAIGYRETAAMIRGVIGRDEAKELIKKNTRNYAKRQLTWFRRYDGIKLFVEDGGVIKTADELAKEAIERI
ncbi:MAG: tRNA (adenosine(37)-N6)-dimethylallyltransferase MiaA, partial [Clostridia bacterium]|nr:tRNA (adenosine(37)-N6)-dimethylallyltransferase MiaA [Clostridia bacterium]